MKTLTKILGIALLAAAAVALSSCTEEVKYTPADPVDGPQVYFSAVDTVSLAQVSLDKEASSFDVIVYRANTDGDFSFNLEVSDTSGLFTIPTAVSFADGESRSPLTIGYEYNEEDFPTDYFYGISLSIPEEYTTPYGPSSYNFTAGVASKWESLGTGIFADYFYFEDTYKVEIFQNEADSTKFRIEYPYAEGLVAEDYVDDGDQYKGDQYLTFQILHPGDVVDNGTESGETITLSDLVLYDTYNPGWYYSSYESYVILYYPYYFSGYETEDLWTHNCVLSYQKNGLPAKVQLAPFYYMPGYGGGWNYSQYDEVVIITFPGAGDYSIDVSYVGKYTDTSGKDNIVANVTLGEDVDHAEVALVSTSDADEAVQAVIDGTADSKTVTASGNVTLPVSEDGTYYIAAVSYSKDSETSEVNAEESATAKVRYSSGTSNFTPSLEALVGTYDVSVTSYYGSNYDDEVTWVIDYSDDEDYDIMLTVFDSFACDYPIYGTFDASTGEFTFYGWQYYRNYYDTYDLWFSSYYYYYISFTLTAEGVFENPTDFFGTLLCDHSLTEDDEDYYLGWNNLYTDAVGERVDAGTSSVKTSSVGKARTVARPATLPSNRAASYQLGRMKVEYPIRQQSVKTCGVSDSANFGVFPMVFNKPLK